MEDSKIDEDAIKCGGWWKVEKIEDITGSVSLEFGNNCYISALDNGLFTLGAPHDDGEAVKKYCSILLLCIVVLKHKPL